MRKVIVTHTHPDPDAAASVWLLKRFLKGWEKAEIEFVPAGGKRQEQPGEEIIHVDTGLGEFDHHQTNEDTCATKLVFEYLKNHQDQVSDLKNFKEEVLERLVNVINDDDHFRQVYYPDPSADYFDFLFAEILEGLNLVYNNIGSGDVLVVDHALASLDAIYQVLRNKVKAEKEIEEAKKNEVATKWGRAIGFETGNDTVLSLAQRLGYSLVVRKDPKKGYVRIKALPDKEIDLSNVYNKLVEKDPEATWYLHPSKTMLLNGTTRNPNMKPTKLSLEEIMEVIKEN